MSASVSGVRARLGVWVSLWGIVLAAILAGASPASAASTLVVDDDAACPGAAYASIQAAVDAAVDGDTILVCAGTYYESVETAKVLTFSGAQAGVDARGRTGVAESIISGTLSLSGAGVVVDGFTVTQPNGNAIKLRGAAATLTNTIFRNSLVGALLEPTAGGATLTRNAVSGGQYGFQSFAQAVVRENSFEAIGQFAVFVKTVAAGVVVADNTANQANGRGFLWGEGTQGLSVTGNTVTHGVAGIALAATTDSSVTDNTISGMTAEAVVFNDWDGASSAGGSVMRNLLTGNAWGLRIHATVSGPAVEAHHNVLIGNTTGIGNASSAAVNAQNNWFGCNEAPVTGSDCDPVTVTGSGPVVTAPQLVLSVAVADTSITVGGGTTLTADVLHNSDGADVSAGGAPVDGRQVSFAFAQGDASPATAVLADGRASTTLTGTTIGTGDASASVDRETVSVPVTVVVQPRPPVITIRDASVAEGNSGTRPMKFVIRLSRVSDTAVTVRFTTATGSARAPSDFIAKAGMVTIPAGARSVTIGVLVRGDRVREPNETFAVSLYGARNAVIGDPVATGVIRNDD